VPVLAEPIKGALDLKNYIDGDWVAPSGAVKDVVNPATLKTIARVPISTSDELVAMRGGAGGGG